jgi:hypothetical protein
MKRTVGRARAIENTPRKSLLFSVLVLLLLAPDLQETLRHLPATNGRDPIPLRELRYVCQTPLWA